MAGAGLPTPPKRATAGLPHRVPSAIAVRSGRGRETRAQREEVYSTGRETRRPVLPRIMKRHLVAAQSRSARGTYSGRFSLMQISLTDQLASEIVADAAVVAGFQDEPLTGQAAAVDAATGGVLERLVAGKEITGRHAELVTLLAPHGVSCTQIVVVGLGRREEFDRGAAFRAMATASKSLAGKKRTRIAWHVSEGWPPEFVESGVCGAIAGCHGQDLYRSERQLHPFAEMFWFGADAAPLESGNVLGESLNLARELVNRPAGEIYPESFAARAEEVSREVGLEFEVWDQERLASERCGLLLGVAQGSARPPRLIIMRYRGGDKGQGPLALVGKGVTFDSGGLSLKPTDGMKTMKCDMAGAAAVLGAMAAIARLKLPLNVVGLAGLVENMVGGNSFKLGDVLRARTGKTVEVLQHGCRRTARAGRCA